MLPSLSALKRMCSGWNISDRTLWCIYLPIFCFYYCREWRFDEMERISEKNELIFLQSYTYHRKNSGEGLFNIQSLWEFSYKGLMGSCLHKLCKKKILLEYLMMMAKCYETKRKNLWDNTSVWYFYYTH